MSIKMDMITTSNKNYSSEGWKLFFRGLKIIFQGDKNILHGAMRNWGFLLLLALAPACGDSGDFSCFFFFSILASQTPSHYEYKAKLGHKACFFIRDCFAHKTCNKYQILECKKYEICIIIRGQRSKINA